MTIGIASLWYNHTELLPEFVRLMQGQPWDRLILVDNASTDEAHAAYRKALMRLGPNATGVRMDNNSVLHGWNAGMAELGTDIVIQMANDVTMADPHWLEWAIDGMAPGILQGPVCWLRSDVLYIDGCCTVAMREDWQRLGGLDAEYYLHPGYWSDIDLCWRAKMSGLTVRPTKCGIRHIGNYTSGGGNTPGFWKHEQENATRFAQRYIQPLFQHYAVTVKPE